MKVKYKGRHAEVRCGPDGIPLRPGDIAEVSAEVGRSLLAQGDEYEAVKAGKKGDD